MNANCSDQIMPARLKNASYTIILFKVEHDFTLLLLSSSLSTPQLYCTACSSASGVEGGWSARFVQRGSQPCFVLLFVNYHCVTKPYF